MKLKLHRDIECGNRATDAAEDADQGSLRFPALAVREMPAPRSVEARAMGTGAVLASRPRSEESVMRHPEMIRQIEATLDRMQASLDGLSEQVENFKFPGARDGERPRAA